MFRVHAFICTNRPDRADKCGSKGAEKLRQTIKNDPRIQQLGKNVRINASGCLGFCESGIASVIYPQDRWQLNLQENDQEKIIHDILNLASHQS